MEVGPRELTGALDLICHYKLLPHVEFFCNKSRPVSVLDTPYLRNVVGDTDIRKGEGMELAQLIQNISSRDNAPCIKPFNLDMLGEAFSLRDASVDLPPGIPTSAVESKGETKDKRKKHKDRDRERAKEHKKHKRRSKVEKEKTKDKNDQKRKLDGRYEWH